MCNIEILDRTPAYEINIIMAIRELRIAFV